MAQGFYDFIYRDALPFLKTATVILHAGMELGVT
jgi:hypothetical protein